jgi:hypothetical protein
LETFPFKEISPVIDTVDEIYIPVAKLIIAVVIAVPAEGPSLGTAPDMK